jgi:Flp pilus assembly protein TadD
MRTGLNASKPRVTWPAPPKSGPSPAPATRSTSTSSCSSGVLAARFGDLPGAEKLLLRASQLAPDAAAPWVNLALVHDQWGRTSDADNARRRADTLTR